MIQARRLPSQFVIEPILHFSGDTAMIKTTIAAVLFGLSVNAFAAAGDISNVTHGSQAGQELRVGQISEPRWSDRNAGAPPDRSQAFCKSRWQLWLWRPFFGHAQLILSSGRLDQPLGEAVSQQII
jgi:hypothetical protein